MAKNEKNESAVAARPAAEVAVFEFGADAGAGFENQTQEDVVLPFVKILEGLSPEVTKKIGEGGVKDARAGMLYNTVTEELIDGEKGFIIVPAHTEHVFVEWRPERGGFVAVHQLDSPVVKDARAGSPEFGVYATDYTRKEGKWPFIGNELVETFYVYGVAEETGNPLVLAFTSTRISGYKKWNSKLAMFQVQGPNQAKVKPPLFANRVLVKTQSHTSGNQTWSTFALGPVTGDLLTSLIAPNDPRYIAAKQVRDLLSRGAVRVNHEAAGSGGSGKASGDAQPTPSADGKVPF